MSKEIEIEGAPPKRFRVVNHNWPGSSPSFDTAEETLEEIGRQLKRHADLDERGTQPRPKITVIDGKIGRGEEISIEKLRQLVREELERRERDKNDPAE